MKFILLSIFFFFQSAIVFSQDSLFNAHLPNHTYHFDIVDGQFVGDGAEILKQAYTQHQYVLLGEYHESPQISKFTTASIPLLDQAGFKTVAFETGQYGLENFLNEIKGKADIDKALTSFHKEYGYHSSDGFYETMIPFFDYYEDGAFLKLVIDNKWDIYGLDQEYQNSTGMLLDFMYSRMGEAESDRLQETHQMALDTVQHYNILAADIRAYPEKGILNSQFLNDYFDQLGKLPENKGVIEGIKKSMNIYGLAYINKLWYDSFITRLSHMKENLQRQITENEFDLSTDKMFVKYGGLHLYKGTSAYECFDIGNTFFELAELNGNKSLHMHFHSRYYYDEGEYIDDAKDPSYYLYDLIKLGKKDQWTLIDLRPFRAKMIFYPQQYKVNPQLRREIIGYDFVIITKEDGTGKKYVPNK